MSVIEVTFFICYGIALTACHFGAALNSVQNKSIWVFVAPPIWLFHPEWFNEKGNKYRKFSAILWVGVFTVVPIVFMGVK